MHSTRQERNREAHIKNGNTTQEAYEEMKDADETHRTDGEKRNTAQAPRRQHEDKKIWTPSYQPKGKPTQCRTC
eukprot:12883371-Prorocentrum_lima.AAC.1